MKYGHNWDEFQWEQEIRRHESRIARFYQGLVYCIDLPAEEAFEELQFGTETQCDPVSAAAVNNPALQEWISEHDIDDENENIPERHPRCLAPVDAVDQLCVRWNNIFASTLKNELIPQGMGIICAFAKLLARVADFTEPEKGCTHSLLLTLGKRSLDDLKNLSVMLENICRRQPSLSPEIAIMLKQLFTVREQLIGALRKLRNPSK